MKNFYKILPIVTLAINATQALPFKRIGAGTKISSESTSSNRSSGTVSQPDYTDTSGGESVSCSRGDMGNNISYDFLRTVMGDEDIAIAKSEDGSHFRMIFPSYVSACLDLDFDVKTSDNNFYIKFKNKYSFDYSALANEGESRQAFESLTAEEKYYRCLDKQYPDIVKNGEFDRAKANELDLLENKTIEYPLTGTNKEYSSKAYIVSPLHSIFNGVAHGKKEDYRAPRESDWQCTFAENINRQKDVLVYESQMDKDIRKAYEACNSEDLKKVFTELSRLKDSRTVGNYGDLINVLENVKDKLREQKADEYLARMKEIERQFQPSEEDIEEGREFGVAGRDEAKELVDEYFKILAEYDSLILDSAIEDLYELQVVRARATPEERVAIDKRVEGLNSLIGRFNKDSNEDDFKFMVDAMKNYNMKNTGKNIFATKSKSLHFSNVYFEREKKERGKKLTFKTAEANMKADLDKFSKQTLREWQDVADLRRGSTKPLDRIRQQMNRTQQQQQQAYQTYYQNYQKDYNKSCRPNILGYVNQYSCNLFQQRQNANQYILGRNMQNFQGNLTQQNSLFRNYEQIYQNALMQRSIASQGAPGGTADMFNMWGYSGDFGMGSTATMTGGMPMGMQLQMPQMQQQQQQMQMPSNVIQLSNPMGGY